MTTEGDPIDGANPYAIWKPVFTQIFELDEAVLAVEPSHDDRDAILSTIFDRLELTGPELTRLAPLLRIVLPVAPPETEFTRSMTGETRGGNIRTVLTQIIRSVAEQGPLLLLLEDVHWMDPASWLLLADVRREVHPMLIVLTSRPMPAPVPETLAEITTDPYTQIIQLDTMPAEDLTPLICQSLGVDDIPPAIGELIRERSEGHPFFAEELAFALRDAGVLLIDGRRAQVAPRIRDLTVVALPPSLHSAITSRIDRLSSVQQLTLKVASVIGRVFALRIVSAVHPVESDPVTLRDSLEDATRLDLTRLESETPELAYLFRHAVTHEATYDLMLFAQRQQLHAAVAEWIEGHNRENIDAVSGLLAYHWVKAAGPVDSPNGDPAASNARRFLELAGNRSLRAFANAEALAHFRELLSRLDLDTTDRLSLSKLYHRMGEAYLGLGKLTEAKLHIVKAMDTLGKPLPGSNVGLVAAILGQTVRQVGHRAWSSRLHRGPFDEDRTERCLEIVLLTQKLALLQFLIGDPNPLPMLFSVLAGLNAGETIEPTPELWSMYATVSAVAGFIPSRSQAAHYKRRWNELGERFDDPNLYVDGAEALCTVASGNGEWRTVDELLAKASAICAEFGDHRRSAEVEAFLSVNALLEGGPKLARPVNNRMWKNARRRDNPIHVGFACQIECSSLLWAGDYHGCIDVAKKCLELPEPEFIGDITEYMVQSAMWLSLWLSGDQESSWDPVKAALDHFAKASVADYSAHLIDLHLAEVAFLALERAADIDRGSKDEREARKYVEKALKNMRKYARVFAIGRPALTRFRGSLAWYDGKHEAALGSWRAAAEMAHGFPMKYEEGRCYLELGRHLRKNDPERHAALNLAVGIFIDCGLENWADVARTLRQPQVE